MTSYGPDGSTRSLRLAPRPVTPAPPAAAPPAGPAPAAPAAEGSAPLNRQQALLASRYKTDGMAASSPQKLVVLIYDRLSRDLDTAVTAIEANQVEAAHKALVNAQDLVFELQLALDPEMWPGAVELDAIYDYLLGLLVAANLKKSVEQVRRAADIVAPLRESWTEAYQMIQRGEAVAAPNRAAAAKP